jgi:hypothetical protein
VTPEDIHNFICLFSKSHSRAYSVGIHFFNILKMTTMQMRKRKEVDYASVGNQYTISDPYYYSGCWNEIQEILRLDADSAEYSNRYRALVKKQSSILRESGLLNDLDKFDVIHEVIKMNFNARWELLKTRELTILAYDVFRDAKKKHLANQAFSLRRSAKRAAKRARIAEVSEDVVEVGDDAGINADLQTPAVNRASAAPTISPSIDFNALAELGFGDAMSRESVE